MSYLIENPFLALLLVAIIALIVCAVSMPVDQMGEMPEELQEIMRDNNFGVSDGQVYCQDCPTTGGGVCGQCGNMRAYSKCQNFFDEAKQS